MIVDTISRVERWARLRRPTLPLMTVAGAMLALLASVLLLVQPAAASPLEPGTAVIGAEPQQSGSDYDADDDGLIEISDLAQLDAVRYDADGDGSGSDLAYQRAFPRALADMGCPPAVAKATNWLRTWILIPTAMISTTRATPTGIMEGGGCLCPSPRELYLTEMVTPFPTFPVALPEKTRLVDYSPDHSAPSGTFAWSP